MKRLNIQFTLALGFLLVQNHVLMSQAPKDGKMECRIIIQKEHVAVGESPAAEVEIKNSSKEDLIIIYNASPFGFLDLKVTDPGGKVISEGKYGGIFSPNSLIAEKQLILRPNQTYRAPVALFGTSKEGDRKTPGIYQIQATYEYEKAKAVSDPVKIELKEIKVTEKILACRFILNKEPLGADEFPTATFELKNVSDKAITIDYMRDPLENLEISVEFPTKAPNARQFWGGKYGKAFKPISVNKSLTLKQGETYTRKIGLFETVPATTPIIQGSYRIQGTYEIVRSQYEIIRAIAPVVDVEIKAVKKR